MTSGSILLGLALLLLVALVLARPFLLRQRPRRERTTLRPALLARKETLLAQIRELDFDHDTGKVPDELYQPQRQQYIQEAAAILQHLEQVAPPAGPANEIEAAIEASVARLRQTERERANGHHRYCPQCDRPVIQSDNFCAVCGHKLNG